MFPEKKILLITSETDGIIKSHFSKNVNKKWTKFDVVIYSPTITMGLSFDEENYFYCIYMYLCNNSTGVL